MGDHRVVLDAGPTRPCVVVGVLGQDAQGVPLAPGQRVWRVVQNLDEQADSHGLLLSVATA
jgi:hypothetical protein